MADADSETVCKVQSLSLYMLFVSLLLNNIFTRNDETWRGYYQHVQALQKS